MSLVVDRLKAHGLEWPTRSRGATGRGSASRQPANGFTGSNGANAGDRPNGCKRRPINVNVRHLESRARCCLVGTLVALFPLVCVMAQAADPEVIDRVVAAAKIHVAGEHAAANRGARANGVPPLQAARPSREQTCGSSSRRGASTRIVDCPSAGPRPRRRPVFRTHRRGRRRDDPSGLLSARPHRTVGREVETAAVAHSRRTSEQTACRLQRERIQPRTRWGSDGSAARKSRCIEQRVTVANLRVAGILEFPGRRGTAIGSVRVARPLRHVPSRSAWPAALNRSEPRS
jgi:hypothetical protein